MTDKELRKMGRGDLLEMLIKEREENESLQARLNASTTELLEKNNQLASMQDEVTEANRRAEEAALDQSRAEEAAEVLRSEKAALEEELSAARTSLEDRRIQVAEAGSIAEASMRIHGIYTAAQASADQYLENIRQMELDQKAESERLLAATRTETTQLMASCKAMCEEKYKETDAYEAAKKAEGDTYYTAKKADADAYYTAKKADADAMHDSMMAATKKEVEDYWNSLSARLESFYDAHSGMREILSFYNMKLPKLGEKPEDTNE